MLQNVEDLDDPITIHCGVKSWSHHRVGELCDDLKDLPLPQGRMYLVKNGVANLLSLSMLAKDYRVYMDTSIMNAFYIFKDDGTYVKFECKKNGLYCLEVNDGSDLMNLLTTVNDQKQLFSELDV